jgi:hypothetical protein
MRTGDKMTVQVTYSDKSLLSALCPFSSIELFVDNKSVGKQSRSLGSNGEKMFTIDSSGLSKGVHSLLAKGYCGLFKHTIVSEKIQFTLLPTAPNDLCSEATPVSVGVRIRGNMTFATLDDAETPRCGARTNRGLGVWFTFTGTGGRVSAVNICEGKTADSYVAIYKGTCGTATLSCHADFVSRCYNNVPFTFNTDVATTYYMLVQSIYSGSPYNYDLMLVSASPNIDDNDVCSTSKRLTIGTTVVSNISLATSDENEVMSDCAGGNVTSSLQGGLWFSFLGTGGRVWVNTCDRVASRGLPTQVSVYKGCGQTTLQCVVGVRDPCSGFVFDVALEKFIFSTEANTTYYVLVRNLGFGDGSSLFGLRITDVPRIANDECSGATPIAIGQRIDGDLQFATPEPKGTINDCMYSPSTFTEGRSGVWYSCQGNGGVATILGNCSSDTTGIHISVYSGTCGAAMLQCVVGFDSVCGWSGSSTI